MFCKSIQLKKETLLALTCSPSFIFAVMPPSDLKFKILNEHTVEMTWKLPQSRIEGFRIQVSSGTGGYSIHGSGCKVVSLKPKSARQPMLGT